MDIEQFIRDLPWSDRATDYEKALVEGNLRGLYAACVQLTIMANSHPVVSVGVSAPTVSSTDPSAKTADAE